MEKILFEVSPWFILLCILAGLLYSIVLYKKKNPWNRTISIILGVFRFISVSLLTFLLLGVLVRQFQNEVIKPVLVVLTDNSTSIAQVSSPEELIILNSRYEDILKEINKKSYQVEFKDIGGNTVDDPQNLVYDVGVSNFSATLRQIENEYEGRNLAGVIFASDGIYNQGISPVYSNFSFPVYSLGLGDTTKKTDVILKSLYHNKVIYEGNKFPIIAEFTNRGFRNENLIIRLKNKGQTIDSKRFLLKKDEGLNSVEFIIEAIESGIQRYTIEIDVLENEFSPDNNRLNAFVEVVEGKEKILLLAHAPHPDIKAIKQAIEKNENYQIDIAIAGISPYKADQYDLAILHQIPDRKGSFGQALEDLKLKNIPVFYILGNKSNLNAFNNQNDLVNISLKRNQRDNVFPSYNASFGTYTLNDETKSMVSDYPPVTVPFGEYITKKEFDVMLYQKIGKITSNKPLLLISKDPQKKEAVFMGEGAWSWRLNEFKKTKDFNGFNEIIGKTIQFLSAKEDKRKFRVYPVNNENWDNTPVTIETEIYNDLYEKIYEQQVNLQIRNEDDSSFDYSFIISKANSKFKISGLRPGIYRYSAQSTVNGNSLRTGGMFSVKKLEIESINITADHQLLKELSRRTAGLYYSIDQIEKLKTDIRNSSLKSIIYSNENYLAFINLKIFFFILLFLFTIEWGSRKYFGGY